jgi:hypothetical protein
MNNCFLVKEQTRNSSDWVKQLNKITATTHLAKANGLHMTQVLGKRKRDQLESPQPEDGIGVISSVKRIINNWLSPPKRKTPNSRLSGPSTPLVRRWFCYKASQVFFFPHQLTYCYAHHSQDTDVRTRSEDITPLNSRNGNLNDQEPWSYSYTKPKSAKKFKPNEDSEDKEKERQKAAKKLEKKQKKQPPQPIPPVITPAPVTNSQSSANNFEEVFQKKIQHGITAAEFMRLTHALRRAVYDVPQNTPLLAPTVTPAFNPYNVTALYPTAATVKAQPVPKSTGKVKYYNKKKKNGKQKTKKEKKSILFKKQKYLDFSNSIFLGHSKKICSNKSNT